MSRWKRKARRENGSRNKRPHPLALRSLTRADRQRVRGDKSIVMKTVESESDLPEGFGEDDFSRALQEREEAFRKLVGTESDVCADIQKRQAFGLKKYGVTVANNPLDLKAWLQHAYEECLDQAVYLKRAIQELEKKP